MSQTITCPSCKTQIDLGKISEEKYRLELEGEFEKERAEMRKKAQEFAEQKMAEQKKKDEVELEDMKKRLEEQVKKEDEFRKAELEMRKKQRELEEQSKNAELEMQRKLDTEKKKLEENMWKIQEEAIKRQVEEAAKIKDEEFRKKELEFLKQQDQLKRSLDDAKRKAEQGSQQIQGDVQEEDLKAALSQAFPIDSIDDVPTGIKWADLIQEVKDTLGQPAGTIVWESKNTKSWTDSWIPKLKDDTLKVTWNIAILVTTVLPKDMNNFGMLDGVMVCLPEYSVAVASLLRDKLLSVSRAHKSLEGKDMKMEMLYKYLGSDEFGSKVSTMIDVFSKLKVDIYVERRAMEKIWKRREKELERAYMATTMLSGDLEWLMGRALPGSEMLELAAGE